MDDEILLDELTNDPLPLGYSAAGWGASPPTLSQYEAIAALLNTKTQSKDRDVSGEQLLIAIEGADFLSVFEGTEEGHKAYLTNLFRLDRVPLRDDGVRTALQSIFSGKAGTLSAIAALQSILISRAQELGIGRVKVGDLRRLKGDES